MVLFGGGCQPSFVWAWRFSPDCESFATKLIFRLFLINLLLADLITWNCWLSLYSSRLVILVLLLGDICHCYLIFLYCYLCLPPYLSPLGNSNEKIFLTRSRTSWRGSVRPSYALNNELGCLKGGTQFIKEFNKQVGSPRGGSRPLDMYFNLSLWASEVAPNNTASINGCVGSLSVALYKSLANLLLGTTVPPPGAEDEHEEETLTWASVGSHTVAITWYHNLGRLWMRSQCPRAMVHCIALFLYRLQ